jgi:hypothetical protein
MEIQVAALKRHFLSLALFLGLGIAGVSAQTTVPRLEISALKNAFEKYQESSIKDRRFTHADLQPLIQKHAIQFGVNPLGKSVLGKSISSLDWGSGQTKVMLWSQMHGNESTATMALFDLFNFLEGKGDSYDAVRQLLKSQLQLKFIPMLNPDGADAFKRRNALDIDLNRDAISLISPEAVVLKKARDDFEPEFGFNLHDQQIYYNVVNTPKQATISLLAPAYNEATEINEVRGRAMQTIASMNQLLQALISGQVGKYDDAFEPRAFGDNIQKWGTSTILIESGGLAGDPEKREVRKINYAALGCLVHHRHPWLYAIHYGTVFCYSRQWDSIDGFGYSGDASSRKWHLVSHRSWHPEKGNRRQGGLFFCGICRRHR